MNGQEEVGSASNPASIRSEAAARHDAVHMRMMREGLPPGVQDGDHAGFGAKMFGIGADDADRLSRRLEQGVVDERLVLEGDCRERRRHGEDDVEIGNRQKLGAAIGEPLRARQPLTLGTVPVTTTIVGDPELATILAPFDMSAERCGAARLDGRHRATLVNRQPIALRGAECVAVTAEDIRHLDPRAHAR